LQISYPKFYQQIEPRRTSCSSFSVPAVALLCLEGRQGVGGQGFTARGYISTNR
jgi:hypothetical protein